jgi:tetratricopeptide (TPR) repeat protein
VPEERLDRVGWPQWLPAGDAVRADFPWTADGCRSALADALERAMLDRRGFLVLSGGVLTGLADQWLSVTPDKIDAALGGRAGVDADVVRWIEDRIPMLRRMDDQLGGQQLRHVVDAELRLVTGLLSDGAYNPTVGSRLYAAAADLGQLAGWVSFDAGLHSAAQRYYVAALHAAQFAGNQVLGANVLAAMSYQATTQGDAPAAISLSQRAIEGAAQNPSPKVTALLAVRQARAYAVAGDRQGCTAALGRAEEAMTRVGSLEEPGWIYYFDHAELAAQAGACRLVLGQYEAANRELNHALSIQDRTYTRDRTIYHLRLATTQLKLGDLEHACSLGDDACDLASGGAGSQRIAEEMRNFRSELTAWRRDPLVRELDERLETYAA